MQNPIAQREVLTMLRTRRALGIMVGLTVLLAILLIIRWPSNATVDVDGVSARQVLRVFGYGLMAGLILLAPVFPATNIVRERVQGTLALLLNAPLSAGAIIVGKLVGVLALIFLLLVLSLPAAAACFAMGGVSLQQIGLLYLVLALLAVQYGTLGLLISSYAGSTDAALRVTYGVILLLAVLTIGPYQFIQGSVFRMDTAVTVADWLRCVSPIPAVMEVVGDAGVGSGGLAGAGSIALRYCVLAALSSALFVIWTGSRLTQRMLDRSRASGTMTEDLTARQQLLRRIMFLWFFDPQRRDESANPWVRAGLALVLMAACAGGAVAWFRFMPIGQDFVNNLLVFGVGCLLVLAGAAAGASLLWMAASANPVTVKEQKTNRFGRGHWMMRLVGGCLIISLLLMFVAATQTQVVSVETMGGIMVLLQIALIVLLTPSLASGLISSERESRGWQLLQMTPLSTMTIISGKLMSVVITLVLVLLATLPAYAVLIYIDPGQALVAIQVIVCLVLTALLALLLSAAVSSLFTHTAAATTTAYGLLVGVCAGTMLFWLAEDAPFSRAIVEKVLMINPLAAALNLMETPGFQDYQLVPGNWYAVGVLCVLSLLVLAGQVWRLTRPR
jgi:ABC-type transport system involved in multi-copper enzyme maturation permease subunit